jgi:HKD family nuclease
MKTGILIEELKERMACKKVLAAVFYSFNFDARFFENYILTQFLPDVSFSDNEIQNAILWKKYQHELPPITVFCDFHAKGTTGPSLAYEVVTVDMPFNDEGRKPCFHPKQSFVLLEDWSLIVIGGSNNLTQSAWCSNIECVNVFHLRPTTLSEPHFYPQGFKWRFQNFARYVRQDYANENKTAAESLLDKFFGKTGYTNEVNTRFFNSTESIKGSIDTRLFERFILSLKNEFNDDQDFIKAEVISPYYSSGITHFNKLSEVLGVNQIMFSVPFENTDYVALKKSNYSKIKESYAWGSCKFDDGKAFRFNHSKIYRLLGKDNMISIVGSVNCTDAAFRGVEHGGNYETAVAYIDDAANWEDQLEAADDSSFTFTEPKEEEGYEDNRIDAFELEFTIDWIGPKLKVQNKYPSKQKGKIVFDGLDNKMLSDKKTTEIDLTPELVAVLADNSLIKFKPSGIDGFMYYYPAQLGLELKPFSAKYNLNDAELLALWQELDEANDKDSMGRLVEKFVNRITDEFDEEKEGELDAAKSSINFMASHLSGLLKLKEKLLNNQGSKLEKEIQKRRISYYLLSDNIDTLIGYQRLIDKMRKSGSINIGFHWVLLRIIESYFYVNDDFIERLDPEQLESLESLVSKLARQIKVVDKKMLEQGVSKKKLDWLNKILLHDFK